MTYWMQSGSFKRNCESNNTQNRAYIHIIIWLYYIIWKTVPVWVNLKSVTNSHSSNWLFEKFYSYKWIINSNTKWNKLLMNEWKVGKLNDIKRSFFYEIIYLCATITHFLKVNFIKFFHDFYLNENSKEVRREKLINPI